MGESFVVAQSNSSQPPPILPMPGLPFPQLPPFVAVRVGDADGGYIVFENNGQTCRAPKFVNFDKVKVFFDTCPREKFLNPENPECSCSAYAAKFPDYGILTFKSGSFFYTAHGNGTLYPFVLLALLTVALIIVCTPFVYYFSYRMSRRELKETAREKFFFQWHRQRVSSLMCLVLICFGFILLLNGVSGQNEIDVLGLFKTTATPGVAFALFGFLIWRIIISRSQNIDRDQA